MIIVDTGAAGSRGAGGKPIRVGLLGAGFMGQGLTNQIVHSVPGMRMSAIYSRNIPKALAPMCQYAGLKDVVEVTTQSQLDHWRVPSVRKAGGHRRRMARSPGPSSSTCSWTSPVRWSSAPA